MRTRLHAGFSERIGIELASFPAIAIAPRNDVRQRGCNGLSALDRRGGGSPAWCAGGILDHASLATTARFQLVSATPTSVATTSPVPTAGASFSCQCGFSLFGGGNAAANVLNILLFNKDKNELAGKGLTS